MYAPHRFVISVSLFALPALALMVAAGERGAATGGPRLPNAGLRRSSLTSRGSGPTVRRVVHESGSAYFTQHVQPVVKRYCVSCHSAQAKIAGLNLARFDGVETVRKDLKPWQGVVDHLEIGDIPPPGSPLPTASEKKLVVALSKSILAAEAKATAGDPGSVPLRRLSNTEYNNTIRDLTGVDLQPAREFPVDGAAGEGFTNAAEALTDMSPALLTKYLGAARDIADHAVMLPDGIRFAAGKTRRDWTDSSTAKLRTFYSSRADADGRVDIKPYLAASIRDRTELAAGRAGLVAQRQKLNPKYLGLLFDALNDPQAGYPLTEIQARWRKAGERDIAALAADIGSWQATLWQTVRVGSYVRSVGKGYAESLTRQLPNNPTAAAVQPVRLSVKPEPGRSDVVMTLTATDLSGASTPGERVVWRNPRLEAPGKPALRLKEYANFGASYDIDYHAIFGATPAYLAAVIEAVNSNEVSVDDVAQKHRLNPTLLEHWVSLVAIEPYNRSGGSEPRGRTVPVVALNLLNVPNKADGNHPEINGWHGKGADLPALITNSSNTLLQIPGNASPHGVMVHPSPSEFVGVVWNSPVSGKIRVASRIVHAHPACGNGVAWWLERRQAGTASMFSEGRLELGGSVTPPEYTLTVQKGDSILLAVDAKDGDHSCDLTQISLKISQVGENGAIWDLAPDVSNSVLAANPHADSHGNAGVWSFVKGPTRAVNAGASPKSAVPSGSLLASWREAVDSGRKSDLDALAASIATLLAGARQDASDGPNRALYDQLVTPIGPLLSGVDTTALPKAIHTNQADLYGVKLPASAFGSGVNDGDIIVPINSSFEVRLPAALMAGRDLVADGALLNGASGTAVLFTAKPGNAGQTAEANGWDGKSPIVTAPDSAGYKSLLAGCDRFRSLFPIYVCFPNVIPNDEVVSLKMFHREDEPLRRLFLDAKDTATLDRLWSQHLFISRQADAENRYLPLFIGFVTQDQPKEMVAFFESMRPSFAKRASDFAKLEEEAIPAQLAALTEFTERAFRRPLTPMEKANQAALYRSMRARGVTHDEAFRAVMARVLMAPAFLFRMEHSAPGPKPAPVNGSELATRLSYFLWSSCPDSEVAAAASKGQLSTPQGRAVQLKRMLSDARVRSLAVEFGAQWLHVRGFDGASEKNEKLFPTFDADLRKNIYEETILFFQDLFQANRPVVNLFNANYAFLNEPLAKHYGIPGISGQEWRKVDDVRKYGRGGILGLATIQSAQSGASRTSPVLRGNWVSETLLGERLPRPPANVPKLPEEESLAGLTIRQQVEMHSKNPACSPCHRRIDPFGYAFEKYDPIGRFRDKDLGGRAVDTHAVLRDGTKFEGIDGLRTYLMTTREDQVMRVFCRRLLGYALGRAVINSDQPLIDSMTAIVTKKGGKMSEIVSAIINSPQFLDVRGSGVDQKTARAMSYSKIPRSIQSGRPENHE